MFDGALKSAAKSCDVINKSNFCVLMMCHTSDDAQVRAHGHGTFILYPMDNKRLELIPVSTHPDVCCLTSGCAICGTAT